MMRTGIAQSLAFIVISQCCISLAFHTQNCDQNQLEVKTTGTLKCLNDHYKELEEMFKPSEISNTLKNTPLNCDFIDRDVACFVDHLGTCFPDAFKIDMATLLDASYGAYEWVTCDRHAGNRKSRLTLVAERIATKYQQYPIHKALMDSIIQFDQNCDIQTAQMSLLQDLQCWTENAELSFQKSSEAGVGAVYFNKKTSMPMCKGVTESFNCFKMNGCLTDQERVFVLNLSATLYRVIMKELVRIEDDFGGFTPLLNVIGEENTPVFMEEARVATDALDLVLEMITDDYKVNCKYCSYSKLYNLYFKANVIND